MSKKRLITPIVMVVAVVLCAAARLFTISQTDMGLGSIKHGYEILCNALYFGVLAAVFIVGMAAGSGRQANSGICISGKSAVGAGFGLLLVGVGAAYDAVLMDKSGTASVFFMAAGFGFAALFIVSAFVTLYKKHITSGLGFAYSFGGVYFVLRGVHCFMSKMAVATIPEYLIEVLCTVLGGVFFVVLGQVLTGNEGKLTRRAFCAWGAAAATLPLSALLGTAAAKLFLGGEVSQWIVLTAAEASRYFQQVEGVDGYRLAFPPFAHIGLGIFAAAMVLAVCVGAKDTPLNEPAADEEQKPEAE